MGMETHHLMDPTNPSPSRPPFVSSKTILNCGAPNKRGKRKGALTK